MPTTLLIYDIEHDGLRAKVANACLDYGLQRIQYSAFAGEITRNRAEELLLRIRRLATGKQIDLRLVPICERDLQQARLLRQEATELASPQLPAPVPPDPAAVARARRRMRPA